MNDLTAIYFQELDNLGKHVQILFGTQDAEEFRKLIYEAKKDIKRLSKRAETLPIVGFAGPKNVGKTTLITDYLFKNQLDAEGIPRGYGLGGRTRAITWYGSTPPDGLDRQFEHYRRFDTTNQTWIGSDVIIGDIPGYSDEDPFAREAAQHALQSCQLVVLIVNHEQYERSDIWPYCNTSYGATLLPVINICDPNINQNEINDYFKEHVEKLGNEQVFLPPVFISNNKHKAFATNCDKDKEEQAQCEEQAQRIAQLKEKEARHLAQRIRNALATIEPGEIAFRIENRMNKFRDSFRRRMNNILNDNIKAAARLYHDKLDGLPKLLAEKIAGDQETILTTIQLTVIRQALYKTSSIWFPYRHFLMLLGLVRGATLSFVLGIAGRATSLAVSTFQAFRNFKKISIADAEISRRLEQRCENIVLDELFESINTLHNRLQEIQKDTNAKTTDRPSVKVIGIDSLVDYSKEQYPKLTDKYTPSLLWLQVTALLGTALFWALIAGPLNTIYGEYLITSLKSFRADEVLTFNVFQTVDLLKLVTAIVLSSGPVLLFGMVMLWSFTRVKRLSFCVSDIVKDLEEELKRRLNVGSLRIHSNDTKLNSLQEMIRLGFAKIEEEGKDKAKNNIVQAVSTGTGI
ncbi:MAG: hypothetical protein RKO25_00165 [Candidatus Contendobacter sp.]|nr:hypothetical protein [Candidatus Contendobacter sp.]